MEINVNKTKHVTFTNSLTNLSNRYKINVEIELVHSFKHLGVFLSSDLSWSTYVEDLTGKSLKKLGLLKSCLYLAYSETRLQAHLSLIRPSLDAHWSFGILTTITSLKYLKQYINKARFITSCYMWYRSVPTLKERLKVLSLVMHRKHAHLSFFHTLYHSKSCFAVTHI